MGIFRDSLKDLADFGTPSGKLKAAIAKLSKLLVSFSSGNHNFSRDLVKQKIYIQIREIQEIADRCEPFDEVRIYFPERTIKTTPEIATLSCINWVKYIVEENNEYSNRMLTDIVDRIVYDKNPSTKYPRAFHLISKRMKCRVEDVKDKYMLELSAQQFTIEELEQSIKLWLMKREEEAYVLKLPEEETPSQYYADWTSEFLDSIQNNSGVDSIQKNEFDRNESKSKETLNEITKNQDFSESERAIYNEIKNKINSGFGSPGETTRVITRMFVESMQRHNYSNKELIKLILESRAQTYRSYGRDLL